MNVRHPARFPTEVYVYINEVCVYFLIYVYTHIYTYIYIYIYMCIYVCICICIHILKKIMYIYITYFEKYEFHSQRNLGPRSSWDTRHRFWIRLYIQSRGRVLLGMYMRCHGGGLGYKPTKETYNREVQKKPTISYNTRVTLYIWLSRNPLTRDSRELVP